jgi:protein-tyrosine-phosphatase
MRQAFNLPNDLASDKKPMTENTPALNVLFLCTHNSARSILAEALLNHLGRGRFKAYSAGSSPRENQKPNPLAIETLAKAGISTEGLYSKSWDAFGAPDAPRMDLVITVCDNAAGEVCPFWPGQPATAHWGYADPSEGDGDDTQKREAFVQTLHLIRKRLDIFVNLPADRLSKLTMQSTARDLARS